MALMPQRGLPVPPMPVMPPEGIAPVTDPASTGTAPDASPTTMVLQYLKARGFTPSSENVRRALEANQRDPGVIPGLRSDRPATEAEDQAAMAAAGKGGGGGSKNTSAPPPGGDLAHPVDLNWQTVNPNPPAGDSGDGVSPAARIAMTVLGLGGAGGLGYAGYKLSDRFNPPPPVAPTLGSSVPPPVDPGAGVRTGAPPETIFPGAATQANPQVAPSPAEQVTPLDTAINRAVPGSVADINPIARPGSLDMAPPRGPVEPVAPVVPFRSDPALRTNPTLRGEPVPLRGVRPGRLRLS